MSEKTGKILIIDDDEDVLQAARLLLKQHFGLVHTEKNPQAIPALLKDESYDVILLDMNFTRNEITGEEGFRWLNKILEIDPSVAVVLITAYGDVERAVRAIKEGATDFVLKPWQNEKLIATLSAAMKLHQSRQEVVQLRDRQKQLSEDMAQDYQQILGVSPKIQQVMRNIEKVAKTEANVLILGENGTGKELVARELHRRSLRSQEVFISVDMGAIPESLFESELFGYVKGAFTDAKEDRAGRFEVASGGTLFLDEIGNLSLPMQAKLLTVLDNRKIFRLGSNQPRLIDIRLICATNMPIYEMVREKRFRQDLLYRINTVEIHLPPLRERREDIALLADYYVKIFARKYHKPIRGVAPSAMKKLQRYAWPGNVRELLHAIERAVIMSESKLLQAADFWFPLADSSTEALALQNYNLEEVEKMVIRKALDRHGGNISRAARDLGLTRTALYRRLEKYGL